MDLLVFIALIVTGFVACAEFGSYAFVHPVLRRLQPPERLAVEQGLLKTFGRVMPIGMTASLVLAITVASKGGSSSWSWPAVAAFGTALIFTLIVNVPINRATGHWDTDDPPPGWERARNRWEYFQGVRSWLLLVGFVLVCAAATA
ncbi:DUF1772 domain-containing protein [Iamia sp.]|uniref:DUF1772 domain-containing protein n=1 Tax=Iamia sp. TaxID=2722710 RepID=UPI002BE85603|nr:DUF1772 domain-containing protein [Iamia sp.]HXH56319.1 DUF1772 domain-containing protein [Iamia sp.]